jgi:hypothetical protein
MVRGQAMVERRYDHLASDHSRDEVAMIGRRRSGGRKAQGQH